MGKFERSAKVVWEGDLPRGNGTLDSASGALTGLPVSWSARVESSDGRTSPEELIAAAHATCYAMAFSNVLAGAGHPPEQLEVSAVVTAELEDGLRVTSSELTVTGRVPGLDQSEFEQHALDAERSCPVSNALRGGIEIRVNAALTD
jgi:osmotically inducible protein OsmC